MSNTDLNQPTAELVRQLAITSAAPSELSETPEVFVVPNGWQLAYSDPARFDALLDHPRRSTGRVILHDLQSFIAYVQRHDQANATTIWVDMEGAVVQAVLNDHALDDDDPGEAGHGDWRAGFRAI